MNREIDRIFLSAESGKLNTEGCLPEETDVIVAMKNGEKFHASFFSFGRLADLSNQHRENGEFLAGTYFWCKKMVLVQNCSRKSIERVVNDLIELGELQEAFGKL